MCGDGGEEADENNQSQSNAVAVDVEDARHESVDAGSSRRNVGPANVASASPTAVCGQWQIGTAAAATAVATDVVFALNHRP